ncbi:hypothetical protein WA026_021745 [Henosepilachna vigintioctopunctata]|uniref:Uncharacterized protein n=1 Tax=Henosepilachna vigintioctopunctata TaxID=420089 RepID=A0AAW1TZV6_9CUCU
MRSHPGKTITILLFTELDFSPAFVTDRPNPIEAAVGPIQKTHIPEGKTPLPSPSISTLKPRKELEELSNVAVLVQLTENIPQNSQALDKEQENIITNPEPLITLPVHRSSSKAVRPLPKAPPRKLTNRGRKTRKSTIYTDTPEKEEIKREYENRLKRTKAKQVQKRFDGENTKSNAITKKKFSEENTQQESSSEEEECYCVVCTSAYSESRRGRGVF